MADYPTTLPAPLLAGYRVAPVDPSIRTEMEFGSPKKRRRTSTRNDVVKLRWTYSDSEMNTFRAWFENDTTGAAGGAGWFNITLNIGNNGSESVEARFIGAYTAQLSSNDRWLVETSIEVR